MRCDTYLDCYILNTVELNITVLKLLVGSVSNWIGYVDNAFRASGICAPVLVGRAGLGRENNNRAVLLLLCHRYIYWSFWVVALLLEERKGRFYPTPID